MMKSSMLNNVFFLRFYGVDHTEADSYRERVVNSVLLMFVDCGSYMVVGIVGSKTQH